MRDEDFMKKFLPMTETAFYILLSLNEPRHGYKIMQHVEEITDGRITIGAGTIYGTLSKLEKDQLIVNQKEIDRKKIYGLTDKGYRVLELEIQRLEELLRNGKNEVGGF